MILYDSSKNQLSFILRLHGSTLPWASAYALPSVLVCLVAHILLEIEDTKDLLAGPGVGVLGFVWSVTFFTLTFLVGFRCNKAYARFWEGCSLVQQMSAEWFESVSNLIAFSNIATLRCPSDAEVNQKVQHFQAVLVRLMSLLHGVALNQITCGEQEFVLIDVLGLDDKCLDYITYDCQQFEINRCSVALHWIQVLISAGIERQILVVPPPILSRCYQTLSRGMVHLHRVRTIADVPYPFPLSQCHVVMLLIQSVVLPVLVAFFINSALWATIVTFVPCAGMWALTMICSQLEQPFGSDPNDLPLEAQQFDFNNSLLMLIHEGANVIPTLVDEAPVESDALRDLFGDKESSTHVVNLQKQSLTLRDALRDSRAKTMNFGKAASEAANVNEALTRIHHDHVSSPALPSPKIQHTRSQARRASRRLVGLATHQVRALASPLPSDGSPSSRALRWVSTRSSGSMNRAGSSTDIRHFRRMGVEPNAAAMLDPALLFPSGETPLQTRGISAESALSEVLQTQVERWRFDANEAKEAAPKGKGACIELPGEHVDGAASDLTVSRASPAAACGPIFAVPLHPPVSFARSRSASSVRGAEHPAAREEASAESMSQARSQDRLAPPDVKGEPPAKSMVNVGGASDAAAFECGRASLFPSSKFKSKRALSKGDVSGGSKGDSGGFPAFDDPGLGC